ncbi:hypothetical protein PNP59_13685 [Halobacterium salinarum]|uniref:hypothetical protein n=1 Tax=Halobacterium salinarum TaxID=2242 RepID=UPI002552DC51|nr:hypothetical protein [Halobacterium salinarum]MDL0130402.1 hypothetical protein [Halobacterium salinarum]MDL0130891.1 hypothetical protein [Halobacterium salinarum]MDL0131960.1 hypothetical protein [Halobacterium salinarum]
MGEGEAVDRRRPQFFEERGVPASVEPPEEMVGVYTFRRDESVADEDRAYTRVGVLTSEGWVPPASKVLVHTVAKTGRDPNDVDALANYTVGKGTRIAIDPRDLRSRLSDSGEIAEDDVSPAIRTQYREGVGFYIPEELDEEGVAEYLRGCVRPAINYYLDGHGGEHPSRDQLADVLVGVYGVSRDAALQTVALAVGDS